MSRNEKLKFFKITENAYPPEKMSPFAAGFDLRSAYNVIVASHNRKLVKTDLVIIVPDNCYGRIASRSGLAKNYFIDVGAGVIDKDYRGNVQILLFNHSEFDFVIKKGDRVAQLVCEVITYPETEEIFSIDKTERNCGGFGSTGI